MRKSKLSKKQISYLYRLGETIYQIAEKAKIGHVAVWKHLKSLNIKMKGTRKIKPWTQKKRGRLYIGKDGYVYLHGGKKTRYHIIVWIRYRGKIPKGYHIHHIDEDKTNYRIKNLDKLRSGEHTRKHQLGVKNPKKGNWRKI